MYIKISFCLMWKIFWLQNTITEGVSIKKPFHLITKSKHVSKWAQDSNTASHGFAAGQSARIRKNILLIKLKQMTTEERGLSHVTSVPRMIRLNMQNVK